ncbi:holin [Microbacterium phage Sansa]|uniref:Holin n=1 Tax=Microbacterium phage Sansa TaxID=2250298 RepID=A0A345KZZ5_9CAUD|nr:holin [Microbacterium phage Sansa]
METVATLATVPAVIALVTLFKDLGLPSKLSPLVAVVLGVALSVLSALALGPIGNLYETISLGVILGLSAAGLYDGARAIGNKTPDTSSVE